MANAKPYQVVRITEETRYDVASRAQAFYRIMFMVGDSGPFYEEFEKSGYSDVLIDQRLSLIAARVARLA